MFLSHTHSHATLTHTHTSIFKYEHMVLRQIIYFVVKRLSLFLNIS